MIWKDVIGYEGLYKVSDNGDVKSVKNVNFGKLLRTNFSKDGHVCVSIYRSGRKIKTFTHRLVAKAFIYNPNNKPQVNHINGIKTDNTIGNLEWVTSSENRIHAIKNGLTRGLLGEENHFSTLTKEQVMLIRKNGKYSTYKKMSEDYSISSNCIISVLKRKTWKHI